MNYSPLLSDRKFCRLWLPKIVTTVLCHTSRPVFKECMSVYMYVCMYVCVYVCIMDIYECMYVCIM